MEAQRSEILPDDSLITELVPPLLVATGLLSVAAFGALLIWGWSFGAWPYLLPAALLICTGLTGALFRRGQRRQAGAVLSYAYGLVPVLTIFPFGVDGNSLPYLAVLGSILAALTVSAQAPLRVARLALLLYLAGLVLSRPALHLAVTQLLVLALLLLSGAVLAWLMAYFVGGTIKWTLEAGAKAERREQVLREAQRDLERLLWERDQLNDKLYHINREMAAARTAAETSYRSKASFMATMSHELRTPLNLIIGYSTAMVDHPEMYDGDPLPEVYRADIGEMRRSGQHLLSLINDILDLAKVEAGRLELNRTALELVPLMEEVLRTTQGLVSTKPVQLRAEWQDALPRALADEVRVRQVLLNLLSNACKFTGMGEIAVGARADLDEVTLWVRDTGIGIAVEDQVRIFSEFEQVDSHDAKLQSGTGLGLSICRWLIELHGGRMWLESDLGKGSIFFFTLPRYPCEAGDDALPAEMAAAALD